MMLPAYHAALRCAVTKSKQDLAAAKGILLHLSDYSFKFEQHDGWDELRRPGTYGAEYIIDDGLWCESSLNYHFTAIVPMIYLARRSATAATARTSTRPPPSSGYPTGHRTGLPHRATSPGHLTGPPHRATPPGHPTAGVERRCLHIQTSP